MKYLVLEYDLLKEYLKFSYNQDYDLNKIKKLLNYSYLNFNHQNLNNHDRYIKIYKNNKQIYEIILSSGVYNILNINKDFTYVLRVIN